MPHDVNIYGPPLTPKDQSLKKVYLMNPQQWLKDTMLSFLQHFSPH